jgi:hypothetical protein
MKKQNKRRKTLKYVDEELWNIIEGAAETQKVSTDELIIAFFIFAAQANGNIPLFNNLSKIEEELQKQAKNN